MQPTIDWPTLRATASAAQQHAYAPYSQFRVGAAALIDDGRVVSGCNIENASYGLTLCAECAILGALFMSGGGRIVAISCVGNNEPVTPCGRCRQLLWEHGGSELLVDVEGKPHRLSELIPFAFPERSVFENPSGSDKAKRQ